MIYISVEDMARRWKISSARVNILRRKSNFWALRSKAGFGSFRGCDKTHAAIRWKDASKNETAKCIIAIFWMRRYGFRI